MRLAIMTTTPSTITELAEDYAGLLSADRPPSAHEIEAWLGLGAYVRRQSARLQCLIDVELTDDPEPYGTAQDQAADLRTGHIVISRAHCDHPIWSRSTNVAYRVVHDVIGHGLDGAPFTVAGEIDAWSRQLHVMQYHGVSEPVIAAAFTETIGQLAYAAVHGDFGAQAIGFLTCFPEAPIFDNREVS